MGFLESSDKEIQLWDSFVNRHKRGSIFYSSKWLKVLEEGLGYHPVHLIVEKESNIIGCIPCFIETIGHFKRLSSIPQGGTGFLLGVSGEKSLQMILDKIDELLKKESLISHRIIINDLQQLQYGNYLYAVDDFNGLLVYSLEDPTAPSLVDTVLFPDPVNDISISENYLYLACGDSGVVSYELVPPAQLSHPINYRTESRAIKVDASNNVILATDLFGTIYLFDSDSTEARYIAKERHVDDHCVFLTKNGRDYLLLPDKAGGFEIISVDRDTEPDQVWFYPGSSLITSVALVDDYAMVTGADDDLTVWAVRSDSLPKMVSSVTPATSFNHVTAFGSIVFVVENSLLTNGWVYLMETSDSSFVLRQRRDLLAMCQVSDIEVEYNDSGDIDVTTYGPECTTLFTVAKKGEPPDDYYSIKELTFVESGFSQTAVERSGGYLYTYPNKGIGKIYDATDIGIYNELPLAGTFSINGMVSCIEIIDTLCYIAGTTGWHIYRMDGYQIGELLSVPEWKFKFRDIKFDWDDSLMFAALGTDGIGVYDVSDIAVPQFVYHIDTPGYAEFVDVSNDLLAVSDKFSVQIFEFHYTGKNNAPILPARFDLAQNYPNPFNSVTNIEFSFPGNLETRYHAVLEIINCLGQPVTTITDELLPGGPYLYTWNGTDASGNEVASGVYFYRLSIDGTHMTKKMVLLK